MNIHKQIVRVYPFIYNKILGGQRKIDIRPYTYDMQLLRVGDAIEYVNVETGTSVWREIKGIALFTDFETMINYLSPEMVGYNDREEIRLRIERVYKDKNELKAGVCALYIAEPDVKVAMKINSMERSA